MVALNSPAGEGESKLPRKSRRAIGCLHVGVLRSLGLLNGVSAGPCYSDIGVIVLILPAEDGATSVEEPTPKRIF